MTSHPHWLAVSYLPSISPRLLRQWLCHFGDIEAFFKAPLSEWLAAGLQEKHITAIRNINWRQIDNDLRWLEIPNQSLLTINDSDYPRLLLEIPDPPLVLYVRGQQAALAKPQLAIVGSRNATPAGLQHARRFATELTEAGLIVTSGLATGIDSAGHRGALSANGATIAVTGTGLHHCYPPGNRRLMEDIVEHHGAIVSEFSLDTRPHAFHFPRRNRIISGLSLGVLVVEAAQKSGSLITVRHALEQGRDVFAIPGSINQPLSKGCHHLIRQGAKLVESVSDILEELVFVSQSQAPAKKRDNQRTAVPPEHRIVFDQIDEHVTPIDRIIQQSRLTPSEVSSILLVLELGGHILSVAGGYVRVANNG